MNDEQLDTLVRGWLERLAADQHAVPDLHDRAVAHGLRTRRRRRALVATALASVLVVAGLGYAIVPRNTTAPESGTTGLDALVQRVRSLHEVVPTSGYWYAEISDDLPCWTTVSTTRAWMAPSGVVRSVNGSDVLTERPDLGGEPQPTWQQIAALPTDPKVLRTRLLALGDHSFPRGINLVGVVGQLLSESPASPALRAALIEVLAADPNTRVVGSATDVVGRTSMVIDWMDNDGIQRPAPLVMRIFLDPSTGRMLAYRARQGNDDEGGATVVAAGPASDDHSVPTSGWAVPPSRVPTVAPKPTSVVAACHQASPPAPSPSGAASPSEPKPAINSGRSGE